ncbi:MAG: hypothetical protein AAB354_08200 [candidate division KSB1 bacterium]
MSSNLDLKKMVIMPALITLAITLLRLTGELLNWAPALFNKAAGGGGALVGISWLVPIFGFYFAWQLMKAGEYPASTGRALGFAALALVVFAGLFAVAFQFLKTNAALFYVFGIAAPVAALYIARLAWPSLFNALFAYGLAARIPVILIMFFAIMNNWGTHYDVPPPNYVETTPLMKWFNIGLFPQLTFWMGFTVVIGAIFGGIAVAVMQRRVSVAKAVS